MTFGSELRKARETAGISVEQLAAQTRIRSSLIREFESDRYVSAGGAAYARGHIRVITKKLGIDPEYLLQLFDSQIDDDDRTINAKLADNNATPSRDFKSPLSWKALGGIAAALTIGALGIQGIVTLSHSISHKSSTVATKKNSEPTVVATKATGVNLQLTGVNGISWVSITDSSGQSLFSGMIKVGQSQTFTDDQLIGAVIGNGAAVKVTLNGQDLGVPGAQGEVLHLQFTPDGSTQG